MALEPEHERLERARQLLRDERPPGWGEVSDGLGSRLRAVVRPGHVLRVHEPTGSPRGSTLAVSSRVLLPRLRDAIDSERCATDSVDLAIEDERLLAVEVDVVCAYGADLAAEGDRVREAVLGVVRELLGVHPELDPLRDLRVRVVDVVEGDPRLS